ncbi:MAG: copper transporter, partial [Actinomycetota bacterium]
LREGLESSVERVQDANDNLRSEISETENSFAFSEDFAKDVEPWVSRDMLTGREIVVLTFDGTNGAVLDSVRGAIDASQGEIVTTLNFSDQLALQNEPEREQLATILGSVSSDPAELRRQTASIVGSGMGEIAGDVQDGGGQRLMTTIGALDEEGFMSVDRTNPESEMVPAGASFIVVGGATDESPFPVAQFVERLSVTLRRAGARAVVGESSPSVWGIVQTIRDSGEARTLVPTVDQVEKAQGRIAVVLALELPESEVAQHYGINPGADDGQIPVPPGGE